MASMNDQMWLTNFQIKPKELNRNSVVPLFNYLGVWYNILYWIAACWLVCLSIRAVMNDPGIRIIQIHTTFCVSCVFLTNAVPSHTVGLLSNGQNEFPDAPMHGFELGGPQTRLELKHPINAGFRTREAVSCRSGMLRITKKCLLRMFPNDMIIFGVHTIDIFDFVYLGSVWRSWHSMSSWSNPLVNKWSINCCSLAVSWPHLLNQQWSTHHCQSWNLTLFLRPATWTITL